MNHNLTQKTSPTARIPRRSRQMPARLEMPRDRNATFEPQLIPKHQRRLRGFNELVISLVARGMTTRDTRAHLQEIYGVEVSAEPVTDAIVPELRAWQQRPLDAVYPSSIWMRSWSTSVPIMWW